jgi:hypothetical protein
VCFTIRTHGRIALSYLWLKLASLVKLPRVVNFDPPKRIVWQVSFPERPSLGSASRAEEAMVPTHLFRGGTWYGSYRILLRDPAFGRGE